MCKPIHTGRLALLSYVLFLACAPRPHAQQDRFRDVRQQMVEKYIAGEGIKNPRVLNALRTVPRHEFVEGRERVRAYDDTALAIGEGQTISPPFIVAYMTESIDPQPTDRVLEIGTGSGYQAAVLSLLAKEVYSIEIVPSLGNSAASRLKRLHYDNVNVKVGDGYKGWAEHAPFDKIIVTCSPENVPTPLAEQLKEGGKMIIPLGERYQQVFHLMEKKDGKLIPTRLISTLFVPMTGKSEDERHIKPDPANPHVVNGGFETDADKDGHPDGWHYQRQLELHHEGAPEGANYVCIENDTPGKLGQLLQGLGVDGRKVRSLRVSLVVKYENVQPGAKPYERPSMVVHFYDSTRRPINGRVVGSWIGASEWRIQSATIDVPVDAREGIVQIGMNGATGKFCVDDVRIEPVARK